MLVRGTRRGITFFQVWSVSIHRNESNKILSIVDSVYIIPVAMTTGVREKLNVSCPIGDTRNLSDVTVTT